MEFKEFFQLTTSRRGRRCDIVNDGMMGYFQLTTSRRGRHTFFSSLYFVNSFNSRPHAEVDVSSDYILGLSDAFQLTTSRRGRRYRGRIV